MSKISSSVELRNTLGKYLKKGWKMDVEANGAFTVSVHPAEHDFIRNLLRIKSTKGIFKLVTFKKFSLFQLILRRFL